jgi:hypothetical protein
MPLTLTPIDQMIFATAGAGRSRTKPTLHAVAMVALGQYRHVAQILAGIDKKPMPTRRSRFGGH